MIQANRSDRGQKGLADISTVKSSPHTDFHDHVIQLLVSKIIIGDGRHHFKFRQPLKDSPCFFSLQELLVTIQVGLQVLIRNGFAINGDLVIVMDQIRRGKDSNP